MEHKYLDELGIKLEKEKIDPELGFDERDTWNTDYTMACKLYEYLSYMREYDCLSNNCCGDDMAQTRTIEIEDESGTTLKLDTFQACDFMLERLKKYLTCYYDFDLEKQKAIDKVWECWSKTYFMFWN